MRLRLTRNQLTGQYLAFGVNTMTSTIYNKNKLSLSKLNLGKTPSLQLVLVTVLTVFMGGCATTYTVDTNLIRGFQEPKVATDKTGVYVIRGSKSRGSARGLWVAVNDSVVANLSSGSHVYLELDAGLNTLHFVQNRRGFGYLTVDNRPGEIIYAKYDYGGKLKEVFDRDLGQTIVLQTSKVMPLDKKRHNDAYDNLLLNPGVLGYPIMNMSSEELTADENHAVVNFYRPNSLRKGSFDIWNQEGYIGSTMAGMYFSVKLKPGRHTFIARSRRYVVLEAELEANKEYAVELRIYRSKGWSPIASWLPTKTKIKLLPIDLNSAKGSQRVKGWKERLRATLVNKEIVESDVISKRIEKGFNFLDKARKNIAKKGNPKIRLPTDFGNFPQIMGN